MEARASDYQYFKNLYQSKTLSDILKAESEWIGASYIKPVTFWGAERLKQIQNDLSNEDIKARWESLIEASREK